MPNDESLEGCVRYGRSVQDQLLRTDKDIQAEPHMVKQTRILGPACAPHERNARNNWNIHVLDDLDRNLSALSSPMSMLWIGINQPPAAASYRRRRTLGSGVNGFSGPHLRICAFQDHHYRTSQSPSVAATRVWIDE